MSNSDLKSKKVKTFFEEEKTSKIALFFQFITNMCRFLFFICKVDKSSLL